MPRQTQVARARATSPEAVARISKSGSEIARPNVLTVVGADVRAWSSVSGSAPPSAGAGLVAAERPTGRSSGMLNWSARARPSSPSPWR